MTSPRTSDGMMTPLQVRNGAILQLPKIDGPGRSILSFAESANHIPFRMERFYYIYNFTDTDTVRGGHAHREFEQVFFCLAGRFRFHLDDGRDREELEMTEPHRGIYVGPWLWHEMRNVVPGTVIFVIASHPYDESDYVRDYEVFRQQLARSAWD